MKLTSKLLTSRATSAIASFAIAMSALVGLAGPAAAATPATVLDFEAAVTAGVDFGAVVSSVVATPIGGPAGSLKVAQVDKSAVSQTWGGTTILDMVAPDTLVDAAHPIVTMDVYSPRAGVPVLLKVENIASVGAVAVQQLRTTTLGWQKMTWDFSTILNPAVAYDRASIFFDFNIVPAALETFYFDNVSFNAVPRLVTAELGDTSGYALVDFGGVTSSVAAAGIPAGGSANSSKAIKVDKPTGAQFWAGTTVLNLGGTGNLLSAGNTRSTVNVYSPVAGAVVKMKIEDSNNAANLAEVNQTTVVGWQRLNFDFGNPANVVAGVFNPANRNDVVSLFFDFGAGVGGAPIAANETFYFDDLGFGGASTADLTTPTLVSFEPGDTSGYAVGGATDFGGNVSSVSGAAPLYGSLGSTSAAQVIKTAGAQVWAGTTFLDAVTRPLALGSTGNLTVTMNVYSPVAGAVVRLKLEDGNDGTHSVETNATAVTVVGWQRMTFDLSVPAPATAAYNPLWDYNRASIFFNFGVSPVAQETYFFDDVAFNGAVTPVLDGPSTMPWEINVPATAVWGSDHSTASVYQQVSPGGYVRLKAIAHEAVTGVGIRPWVKVSGGTIQGKADAAGNASNALSGGALLLYANDLIRDATIDIAAGTAGTVTVTAGYVTEANGQFTFTTQQTFTINLVAVLPNMVYDHSVIGDLASVNLGVGNNPITSGTTIYAEAKLTGVPLTPSVGAKFNVRQWANAGATLPTATAGTKPVTITVDGAGILWDGNPASPKVIYLTWAAGTFPQAGQDVYILNDGRAGVSTVTVTVNGKVVDTRQVVFQGALASATVTVKVPKPAALDPTKAPNAADSSVEGYLASGDGINNPGWGIWSAQNTQNDHLATISALDANGKPNLAEPITCTASDATIADWGCWTYVDAGVRYVGSHFSKAGTVTFTFKDSSGNTLTTADFTSVVPAIATLTAAAEKAVYAPGEKVTVVFTAKDANGNAIPAGKYQVIGNWVSSADITVALPTAVSFGDGTGVVQFYAPLSTGPVSMEVTLNSFAVLATGLKASTIPVTFKVQGDTKAAADIAKIQEALASVKASVEAITKTLVVQIRLLGVRLSKLVAALNKK